ncbi:uncharacterized protein LOC124154953 [Ischnura elegans]|uniref:uncharacterized protein LOC124154953 n=1 Tax=Ischnura elegans TaxID=197161 RepID=UPI001ED8B9C1|nr:uncharacterized protein LOC124154953 [Ischnura elegans]
MGIRKAMKWLQPSNALALASSALMMAVTTLISDRRRGDTSVHSGKVQHFTIKQGGYNLDEAMYNVTPAKKATRMKTSKMEELYVLIQRWRKLGRPVILQEEELHVILENDVPISSQHIMNDGFMIFESLEHISSN